MRKIMLLFAFFGLLGMQVFAQKTITGTVTSADDGSTLPGVSVLVKGTTIATVTDIDGKYVLKNVPDDATTLVFSFMGMETQEVAISGDVVDCALKKSEIALDEVVVTALGIKREKKALSYGVQDISGDELSTVKTDNVVSSLSGKVAGVQITQSSGAVGASARITIRGNSSFNNNNPLFVVDGVPISNGASAVSQWGGVDFGNNAMDIDPSDIESISVLKGANATALYGSRGANGVILITTKKASGKKGLGVTVTSGVSFDNVYILPDYQNKYGQGYFGSEYYYKKGFSQWLLDNYGSTFGYDNIPDMMEYSEYATGGVFGIPGFSYVDGNWGGVMDGMDESWGPRLDIGLMIPQFDSPYTVDPTTGEVKYDSTPWVSHPDNVKNFFQTGITYDNNLAIAGGNDKANARLSVSNMTIKGVVPNTDLSKTSINLNSHIQMSDKFSVTAAANYIHNHSDNLPGGGYDENNVMQSIGSWFGRQVDMNSLRNHWNELDPYGNPYNWNHSYHNNPYWTVNKNTTTRTRDRMFGYITLQYNLTDWLNIMGRVGNDFYTEFRKHVVYDKSIEAGPGGNFWQSQRSFNELNGDLFLNFDKTFGDIRVDGLVGANYRRQNYNYMYLATSALTVPDFFVVSNASGNPSTDMYRSAKETNSLFANANFSYKNFAYLNASVRNDWSSTLPAENRSYLYYSLGGSFIFTEAFGLKSDLFSFGKIRASYAKVGNDTDPYQLSAVYGSSTDLYNGVAQYFYTRQLPPLGLKPESVVSMEAGLELKFLKDRFGLDFTVYDTKSFNQILSVDITPSTGFTSQKINAGEIENKGIEVVANFGFVKTKNFAWNMAVNWSTYTNMVNKLYGDLESYQFSSSWKGLTVEARPGEEFGMIRGKGLQRDAQGRILIDPTSGMPQATQDPIDLGSVMPDWIGGVRNTFTLFNNLSMSVLVDGRMGGKLFSVTDWFGAFSGILSYTAEGDIRENGVVVGKNVLSDQEAVYGTLVDTDGDGEYETQYLDADGNPTDSPVANTDTVSAQDYYEGYYGMGTELSVMDASYIKLREASITYALPKTIVDKISFVQGISLSFVGHNLALLYVDKSNRAHIDPETGFGTSLSGMGIEQYQIPSTRSLGFKLQVKF